MTLNLVNLRPDLVRSAAAHEPGPFSLLEESKDLRILDLVEEDKRSIAHVTELIEAGQDREAAEYFVDEVAVGPGAWARFPDELRTVMVSNASTVPDDLQEAFDPASLDVDALAGSDVPMLVTTGGDGPPTERAAVDELIRRVPAAHLAVLEGAGHIPHRTHPDEYVEVLTEFIDGLADDSPPRDTTGKSG